MAEIPRSPDAMTPFQRLLRRRKFLIHRKLQYQLLLGAMWHLVLVVVSIAAILFLPLALQIYANDPQSDTALRAANHLLYLHGRFWPAILLVSLLIGLDTIRTSHRIAGPILRFRRALDDVCAGRVPRTISLRRGDVLLEECAQINEAIREAEARIRERERVRSEILESAAQVRSLVADRPTALTAEQRSALENLLARAEGLEEPAEKAA